MRTALLSILYSFFCISASAQAYDPNWDIKIRDDSHFGIALSQARLLDMAIDDAKELTAISPFDSIQFVHEMNGYWYVFTDKGAEGYVKDLRYRSIDLDSLRMAPILAERARLAALEQARLDSIRSIERITKAYALYDSVTARRLLDRNLWVGMTPDMALISIGDPAEVCYPDVLAPCVVNWDYAETELRFQDGLLAEFKGKAASDEDTEWPLLEPAATDTNAKHTVPDSGLSDPTEPDLGPAPAASPKAEPVPDLTEPNPTGQQVSDEALPHTPKIAATN